MKLMSTHAVAVYTADQCTLFPFQYHTDIDAFLASCSISITPDVEQLKSIQRYIDNAKPSGKPLINDACVKRLYVLVPDDWLSVTQYKIHYSVPTELLPLAALSHAAEVTFSPPETVLFDYYVKPSSDGHTSLTVYACSKEWEEALLLPFRQRAGECVLMSYSQWRTRKIGFMPRIFRSNHEGLCSYDPERKRIQKNKKRWRYVLLLSLIINTLCYGGLQKLSEQNVQLESNIKVEQNRMNDWLDHSSNYDFPYLVLALAQGLPNSVRLVEMQAQRHKPKASFRMTLMESEWENIFKSWQKRHPQWHWEISLAMGQIDSPYTTKEVVDVFVNVTENSKD